MTEPQKWNSISQKTLHQTAWIQIIEEQCQLPTGETIDYTFVKRVGGCSVIAVTPDQKLLLTQQYRHPIGRVVWQFPAEGIEPGESFEACAHRCLLEETHHQAKELIDLGLFYADPGTIQQDIHWFLAKNVAPLSDDVERAETDQTEDIRTKSFTLEQVKQMIQSGEICDNWTLAGLTLFELNHVIPE